MSDDERRKLFPTGQSLEMEADRPKVPTGLEVFGDEEKDDAPAGDFSDADSFFNLPGGSHDDDEDEDDRRR